MAKARFSYVPNIPTPGEAQLAGAGPNDPVAGIHLLNAQMERRAAIDAHNATMEQIMETQNAQAAQQGHVDLLKAMASASNPMFQAEAARMGGASEDEITRLQQMEAQAALAENMQRAGAGLNSFSEAGVQGADPLSAFGLPDNMKMGTRPDVQREAMGNETTLKAAQIGANATVAAAKQRGSSGETKPSVSFAYTDPKSSGTYQFKGGNLATVQNEASSLLQGDTPLQQSTVSDEEMQSVMPSLQTIAAKRGEQVPTGARPRRVTRGGDSVIVIDTIGADGSHSEVAVRDRSKP